MSNGKKGYQHNQSDTALLLLIFLIWFALYKREAHFIWVLRVLPFKWTKTKAVRKQTLVLSLIKCSN